MKILMAERVGVEVCLLFGRHRASIIYCSHETFGVQLAKYLAFGQDYSHVYFRLLQQIGKL